jgi:hypothetical protein
MTPLVGYWLETRPHTSREAALGEPTWGPTDLLRDLELRLGLPSVDAPLSRRVPQWARRIDGALASSRPFFARSFEVDRVGTALTLLQWRDALVDAGWDGQRIAAGGDRLDALADIESTKLDEPAAIGAADRLASVERELRTASKHRVYERIRLADERTAWPGRWRTVFRLLEERGTSTETWAPEFRSDPPDTDLGLLQRRIRGQDGAERALRGDGSLRIVRGDTSTELAELTAAMLAHDRGGEAVVVRCTDIGALDGALARQGLPRQGHIRPSEWRPAMQILRLSVEIAFEPRDPFRVLELLTLPVGPFRGLTGRTLARAVSRQPGIGGQEWLRQRTRLAEILKERAPDVAQRLEAWIERPGFSPDGAPRDELVAVAERVREWLQKRMGSDEAELYGAAYAQARAFGEALVRDARATLTREDVRNLLDELARTAEASHLSVEEADRTAHVSHPSGLLTPADSIFAWACIAGTERRAPLIPWNADELAALSTQGIVFQDARELLRGEADALRRIVLAARKRLVFLVPGTVGGEPSAPHPLLDEISARLRLDEGKNADAIVTTARAMLRRGGEGTFGVETLAGLPLPEGRPSWNVDPEALRVSDGTKGAAATSLERLVTCPLSWVLAQRARLRPGAIAKVASGPLLYGNVSHRLVEELFREGAFELEEAPFAARVEERLRTLVRTEGATLLLPGASNEREQLARQIVRAMRALHRYLRRAGFRIAGVEEQVRVAAASGDLEGRLDLRLVDDQGKPVVLDLKWGKSTYETALREGRAVQLAAYSRAIATTDTDHPPAGYFALKAGKELATDPRMKAEHPIDGPSLEETWERAQRTALAVIDAHKSGKVMVLATRRSLPLLDALGVPEARQDDYLLPDPEQGCKYCSFDVICGKAWEAAS